MGFILSINLLMIYRVAMIIYRRTVHTTANHLNYSIVADISLCVFVVQQFKLYTIERSTNKIRARDQNK